MDSGSYIINTIMINATIRSWFTREPITVEIEQPHESEENVPLPSIVLIHGANQSNVSFEYLRHALPGFQYINIEWNPTSGFYDNLKEMIAAIKDSGPVYLVGHSMGCIYAAHLSQHVDCIGGAALSAPWGGSKAADWMRYMTPSYPLYKEVGTKSPIIIAAREFVLPGRWTNYISTQGDVPGMGGKNDCVLTIDSMSAKADIKHKFIKATHYEILMSTSLIQSIGKNFLHASEKY
jgi:pimeloyl-ACP methyl ester carboxylesterase